MIEQYRWQDLREQLERGQLALFLGADLPQEVTSLPSRADLAQELARRHGLDESLSLAEVAQRVERAGNRWEFTAFIRDALDATRTPRPFHQRVAALVQEHGIETLITTAYDSLLELAFQEEGVAFNRVVRGSDVSFINPDRPTLIKLYGDAQQPDTLVVTDRDHSDLLRDREREAVIDEVRTAFRRNTMLFLGYNLSDPDFRFLFDQVAKSRFARTAYAIWPGFTEVDVQMWWDRGIAIMDADPLGVLIGLPAKPRSMVSQVLPLSDHVIESLKSPMASDGPSKVFSPIAGQLVYDFVERFSEANIVAQMDDPQVQTRVLDRCACGGEIKEAIFAHPHPLYGCKFKYMIRGFSAMIKSVRLDFFIGILDKSSFAANDSICFEVHIDGKKRWGKKWNKKQWDQAQIEGIEISPGRVLEVVFATDDCGRNEHNWAVLGSPVLVVEELRTGRISRIGQVDDQVSHSTLSSVGGEDMDHKRGFQALKECLTGADTELQSELATLEDRFRKNERAERIFGTSENTRNERSQIIFSLNEFALKHCGISFNDLCMSERQGEKDDGTSASPTKSVINTGKAWAVLVGINAYDDAYIADLKVCVDDVTAIHSALSKEYQVAKLLTDATPDCLPTRANILGELSAVAQNTGEGDLLLFYFSGHGVAEGGESYLLARDTRLSALKHTAVAMRDVRELMEGSPARAKVIVLDACHSGASIGKAAATMTPEFIQRVFEEARGIAVLASCEQGQQSWEWRDQGRSVFTSYLLEALEGKADFDGKGFVTVSDASRYVSDGVKTWAAGNGVPQTPTLQYTVAGDIILVTVRGGSR